MGALGSAKDNDYACTGSSEEAELVQAMREESLGGDEKDHLKMLQLHGQAITSDVSEDDAEKKADAKDDSKWYSGTTAVHHSGGRYGYGYHGTTAYHHSSVVYDGGYHATTVVHHHS